MLAKPRKQRSDQFFYIAHHSFVTLTWENDLAVMLKSSTGTAWQGQAAGT